MDQTDLSPFPLPAWPRRTPAPGAVVDGVSVGAALVTEDRRFLLQLRDSKPDIVIPGHWAFFAGTAEPGENPDQAILREVEEELNWRPPAAHWLSEAVWTMPRYRHPVVRRVWYQVPLPLAQLPRLELREGAGMRLFTLEDMMRLPRIAPWDLAAAMLLARGDALFPEAR